MNLLANIRFHIADKGLARTLSIIFNRTWDRYFDWRHKTDTISRVSLSDLEIRGGNKKHGSFYQPTMARSFKRLLKRTTLPPEPVLVDFGCGKGRVLLLAALYGVKKAVGIEFSPELCRIARENVRVMERAAGRPLNITVVEDDVCNYRIRAEENVFFLFNPFDDVILEAVVKNLQDSLAANPRPVVIFYYNPVHSHVLDFHFLLTERMIIGGEEYLLYRNR